MRLTTRPSIWVPFPFLDVRNRKAVGSSPALPNDFRTNSPLTNTSVVYISSVMMQFRDKKFNVHVADVKNVIFLMINGTQKTVDFKRQRGHFCDKNRPRIFAVKQKVGRRI